jgi:hypothetical protein
MAQDVQIFPVTVPAGTPKSAPQVTNLVMPPRSVTTVEVVVPSGCRGLVGFALGSAGVPVIPVNLGTYIVTDGEVLSWPLEGFWDSGAWQLTAYNTGKYPHTLQVRFLCALPTSASPTAQPLSADALSSPQAAPAAPEAADEGNGTDGGALDLSAAPAAPTLVLPAAPAPS